jgi:TolB-like protein/Flp pilus assembly protein TadD
LGFFNELRRRKVTRVAAVYVVTAWVLLQVVDVVSDPLHLPDWFATTIAVTLIIGFPLAVLLAWAFELTPDGVRRASAHDGADVVPPGQSRIDYALMGLLVVTMGWMVYTSQGSEPQQPGAVAPAASVKVEAQAPAPNKTEGLQNSIAVLPFDNLSPDPDNAYFAAGIHEEVLNQLAKINDLSVIARTSVMQYAGVHRPIAEIADELNVSTVMEGSVRYAGNRVRITAQLIDATTGAHLWSEAFEDDLEDIFGIQLAIATRIADALEAEFSPAEQQRVGNRTTDSPEAYAHYLRAVSSYGSFRPSQPVHAALDAALALDPEFDTALAFKAFVYGVEGTTPELVNVPAYNAETVRRARALADDYARRALALNPEEGRAFHAMSLAQFGRREWQAALESAERAYTLSPNDYLIAFWMGRLLALAGDEEEGIALQRRALELNPNDMFAVWALGVTYEELGRWQESLDQYRIVAAVAPDVIQAQGGLALSSYFSGDLQTTRDIAARFESQGDSLDSLIASAGLYGRLLGDAKAARRVFDLAVAHPQYDTLNAGLKFGLYSAVKDGERAIGYLERMVDGNFPGYVILLHFRPDALMFDAVRSHPKFDELVQRMAKPVDG